MGVPDFLRRVSQLVATAPLAQWKAYLRARLISDSASWLSTPFVQENFAFSSRFTGAKQLLPRWKRCLRETDGDLGEALGQAYVAKTFPPEAKARARAVIEDVRAAFRVRLQHLSVDVGHDPHAGARQARQDEGEGRLPRSLARLRPAGGEGRPVRPERRARQRVRVAAHHQPARPAGGQDRVGHHRAHGERLLRPDQERGGLPRRRARAADLRPEGRRRRQLRLPGRELGGARDHARLRRRGPPLRRGGQPARLVATPADSVHFSEQAEPRSCSSSTATSRWTPST